MQKNKTIISGWEETTLGEVCSLITDGKHGDCTNENNSGYFFISAKDVNNGRINYKEARQITQADFEDTDRRTNLQVGDILVTNSGTIGRIALVRPNRNVRKTTFQKSVAILKPIQERIGSKYLYYYLLAYNRQIVGTAGGTTQQNLLLGDLRRFEIRIHQTEEQKAIAAVLTSFDDKIELLRRQNKTLEKIAQTIFKEWFVNFTVNGKKLEIDNATGLPEGWTHKSLDEIADFLNGLALQKYPPENEADALPVIKIRELKAGITEQTDKASKRIKPEYIVDDGDVLFSWSGSLEVVLWCHGKGALNQHLFKVTSKEYPKWFYYFWILEHLPFFKSVAHSKATTMGHIQRYHLTESSVAVADVEFMVFADSEIAPVFEHIISNNGQIQTLSKLRDTLLPRLMKGEIRVRL